MQWLKNIFRLLTAKNYILVTISKSGDRTIKTTMSYEDTRYEALVITGSMNICLECDSAVNEVNKLLKQ